MPYGKLTVPLGLGIQTDVDDKLLPVGKVVRLENGVWQRSGEVIKRPGSYSLGVQYAAATPGTMPAPWQLATHKGALVSVSKAGPRPLGVYSPQLAKWMAPAGTSAADNINGVISKLRGQVLHKRSTVFRSNSAGSSARVTAPDIASNGTYYIVGWIENNDDSSLATARAQIIEIATGKTLFTHSVGVSYTNCAARVMFANGDFQLIYIDGANVKMVNWSATNITAGQGSASGVFTLATDATTPIMDVIARGNDTLILYAGATTRFIKTTSGGATTVVSLKNSGGFAVDPGVQVWMKDLSGSGALAAIVSTSTGAGTTVQWNVNTTTGVPTASYTVDATVGSNVFQLAGHTITNNATGEFVVIYYENLGPGTHRTYWGRRSGGVITKGTWIWDACPASKTFIHGTDFYVVMAYESNTQGALFVVRVPTNLTDATDGNRTPSARMCTGVAGTRDSYSTAEVVVLSTDVFLTTTRVNVRLEQIASVGATSFDTGVDSLRMTFNPTNVNTPREFADSLYVCGGILGAFDGKTFSEEGFHLSPEAPSLTTSAGGGLTNLGNYIYQARYRYADEFGRFRWSTMSPATSISLLVGGIQTVNVTVQTLKLHGHLGFSNGAIAGKVTIEIFRNINGEDTMELLTVINNDESVHSVTYVDTLSDTALTTAEPAPTGDILDWQPAPAALAVTAYKDRIAVIDADDPTLIRVSLPLVETEGPRFNDVSAVRVDDGRGDLTCHAAIDDRLVAFKQDSIYTIPGDGPDADGNGFFGLPSIIANGIGCSEPRSIVQVPDGIMFHSSSTRSGIHMVNRGLAVEYIGAPVQSYLQAAGNSAVTIVDAVHLPGLQRTKFYLSSGYALVYDHTTKLWSTDTNQTALAATAWQQGSAAEARTVYQISSSNMFIVAEDSFNNTFSDTSSPVEMYVETPWLSLADIKGFFRFKRIQLAGDKRIINDSSDPGYKITMYLWKDFDQDNYLTTPETRDMSVTDDINAVEMRYSTQVSALKVGVRISQKTGDPTNFAGPKLSAISVVYTLGEGLRKTPYTKRLT